MTQMLKVKPVGTLLVPDYQAQEQGVRRFVGRKLDASVGINGGFVPLEEAVEIPYCAEYAQALKEGDLEPCCEASAKLAGKALKQAPKAKV